MSTDQGATDIQPSDAEERQAAEREAGGKSNGVPEDPCKPKPGESPKEALARLKACREARRQQQKTAETEASNAEAQISAIEQTVGELEAIVKEYTSAHPDLAKKRDGYRDYLKNEKNCLESILKTAAPKVCDAVAKLRKVISDLKAGLPWLDQQVEEWRDQLQRRTDVMNKRKAELDAWKGIIAAINAAHGELDRLKGEVAQAYGKEKFAIAYWYLTDKEKGLEGILASQGWPGTPGSWAQPIGSQEFAKQLYTAASEYIRAIASWQEATVKLADSERNLDALKSKIKDLEDTLGARILAALEMIKPDEAAAA